MSNNTIAKDLSRPRQSIPRKQQREQAQEFIDTLQGVTFPNSQRIYLQGSRPDIQVPMREIQLSPTLIGGGKDSPHYEENEAIPVYDTSGPYGDPRAKLDVHAGLPKLRESWIADRQDTAALSSVSSGFTQQRLADEGLDHLRFEHLPRPKKPLRANVSLSCITPGQVKSPQKWSLSPCGRIWGVNVFAVKYYANSMRGKHLVRICQRISPQNLSDRKWPLVELSSPRILTTPNLNR